MIERRSMPDHTVITGGAGWLGRALVSRLGTPGSEGLRRGLRVLVRDEADRRAIMALAPEASVVVGDVTRPRDLTTLFHGTHDGVVDVVHTAGVIHPERWSDFDAVNAGGTRNVLAAAALAGVRRFVHISSNSPFGTNPDVGDTFRNDEPYDPYYGYGLSKMHAEVHVRGAVEGGLDAVMVRPPWFYGPFQPERQTTFFTMIRKGRFPIIGSGAQRRSMVYIDNLVDGVLLAELVVTPPGRGWWIADECPYPLAEIVATVGRALHDEGYDVTENRIRVPALFGMLAEAADRGLQRVGRYHQAIHVLGEMDKTIAVDISGARAELGYEPRVSLYDGMRESIRWCRAQGISL
ncbi:MAG: NAD(P)-dependent oxidoreductase [Acidimicrobiia bacterium]|nr:NAD(P)-dependent oxidoreductase [Acidimicrobiia bacterium]